MDLRASIFQRAHSSSAESDESELSAQIARLEPREIVASESLFPRPAIAALAAGLRRARDAARARNIRRRRSRTARVGIFRSRHARRFRGAHRRRNRRRGRRDSLHRAHAEGPAARAARPQSLRQSAVLEIDAATRANLELTRTLSGQRDGLAAFRHRRDRDVRRREASRRARLARRSPMPKLINARLDAVAFSCK